MSIGLSTPVESALVAARMRSKRRSFRMRRPLRQLAPRGIEREYQAAILRLVRRYESIILENLVNRLPEVSAEAQAERGDSLRLDDSAAMITDLIAKTRSLMGGAVTALEREIILQEIAHLTADFNKQQLNKVFRSVLAVDLITAEPYLATQISGFIADNVSLIESIPDDMLYQVEGVVRRGTRTGLRHEDIARQIQDRFNVTRSRARLIGRDQVNKFNGELTKIRQSKAGVTHYIWRTAGDERVRESHAMREGRKYAWSDPPDGGNPGEAIQCRCSAEPVLEGLVDF